MSHQQGKRAGNSSKNFEDFLYFVAFSLIFRLFPFIENFTDNNILRVILGLVIVGIIIKIIPSTQLSFYLKKICERFNINIITLYFVYIVLYLVMALM